MALFENLPYGGQYLPQAIKAGLTGAGLAALGWAASGGPRRVAERKADKFIRASGRAGMISDWAENHGMPIVGRFFGNREKNLDTRGQW